MLLLLTPQSLRREETQRCHQEYVIPGQVRQRVSCSVFSNPKTAAN